ncbi:hypothetical protein U3516DRAFT_766118 [Neocallimastix sp. 'constans']
MMIINSNNDRSEAIIKFPFVVLQKKVLTQASYLNHRIKRVVFAALLPASRVAHFVNNLVKGPTSPNEFLNHNLITHTVLHFVAQKFSLQTEEDNTYLSCVAFRVKKFFKFEFICEKLMELDKEEE